MKVGIQKQEGVINDHQEMIVICTEGGQWGDIWYISSIFSHHIAGNLNVFKRIKHIVGVDTRSGENSFLFTRGVGAVEIKSSNETMRIQSVFYSPELDRNVLSLDQLTLQGYTVNKSGDTCKIFPMFSTPVINSVNDMSGLTKEDEIGLKELQGILDVSTMDDEFKERYLNSYFEELNLSSQETDWSLMIIKTMEFHEFADCKSLLDMIDDREFIFKYKHVLEAKFEEMVTRFLNVNMGISSRPVPPYAPTKRKIDLLGLYVTVERDGGYRSVTNDNSWPVVAKDLGYDYQDGEYMRIIYAMHLDILVYYYRFKVVQEKVFDKEVGKEGEGSSFGCHKRRKSAGDAQDEAASDHYALYAGNEWEGTWNLQKKRRRFDFNHARKAVEEANRSVMQHARKHN
ncbi:putative transcription factor & chromatin remodeling ARID family [Helianthus annuus]|uniref:Transcription factor & chromatin remodeling ARID family n=1 Tax=Helianthus annuus TaxID=4232 RepID=A0A9K3NJ43_HELAN|nr:putative transcription factor & chromatin remodeling ARID family [Helianthus annuus]KAJ0573381.1 putative transcription factor & chromatin remodeling ARID family [Helianthus annuus]KAJ0911685.1 putative transcription factor & chromatin remodeling ARID family [Helianthus annuus]